MKSVSLSSLTAKATSRGVNFPLSLAFAAMHTPVSISNVNKEKQRRGFDREGGFDPLYLRVSFTALPSYEYFTLHFWSSLRNGKCTFHTYF